MANITEVVAFNPVYRIETTDPVLGGAETAIANLQAKSLTDRTAFLKDVVDKSGVASSVVVTTGSMDTVVRNGNYYIQGAVTGKPSGETTGFLRVTNNNGVNCVQFFTSDTSDATYFRRVNAGSPSAWVRQKNDAGNDLDVAYLQARVITMINQVSEPAVILSGGVPTLNASTLTVTAGIAVFDGQFVDFGTYSGVSPVYLRPDGTFSTLQPGSGAFIKFDPLTSQDYKSVLRRYMTPIGKIEMLGGANDIGYFGIDGLGKWQWSGFALCDGRNGTIDMGARFPVGYKTGSLDYATVGNTGGAETVTLTENQMPVHRHGDATIDAGDFGLIRKSQIGENRTTSATDTSQGGIEPDIVTSPSPIPTAGGGQSHENRPPFMTLIFAQRI